MTIESSQTDPQVQYDPFFGLVAPSEGWVPPLRYLLRRERILSILARVESSALLEAGCGAGALLADLSRRGFDCIGLEPSVRAASLATRMASASGSRYQIVTEPQHNWDATFGVVCAFDVLEHIEDDQVELARWVRWVRPGGKLLLSVPAHSSRWGAGDVWAGHYRRYDRKPLIRLIASQGMSIDHIECYGFPLANFTEWFGQRTYRRMLAKRNKPIRPELASAESGIQRDAYLRKFPVINSSIGRFALRVNFRIQRIMLKTNFGSGYLILASKP